MSDLYDAFIARGPEGVVTDSRKVSAGDIFFALRGENHDGNLYAAAALETGAALAVVDDRFAESPAGRETEDDARYVVVPDTLSALQRLARYHREKLGIPVIALTGSNGKTTTKELLARVLGVKFNVGATRGNLNNHIGVPLTLLSFGRETEFGIVEMGANHFGEITDLCNIALPEFGIITNIGKAHLEGFKNLRGVRKAKGELFDYLASTGGRAFYAADDPVVEEMVHWRPALDAVPYSLESFALEDAGEEQGRLAVEIGGRRLATRMVGAYNIRNVVTALAIGRYFDVDRELALEAIASYEPDNNRSQKVVTARNTLYMDAYNANPSSMAAALENFSMMSAPHKIVILGDMLELGDSSSEEHRHIVELAAQGGYRRVLLVGEQFAGVTGEGPFKTFGNIGELTEYLSSEKIKGANILIKGSRGIGLEKVAAAL